MKNTRWTAFCGVLVCLSILCAPSPGLAQEFFLLGGGLARSNLSDPTYAWALEYIEGIGENFAASFSYLNEGHLPDNHRDGVAAQLWIRKQFLNRQLSLGVGAGPYRYFDTRTFQLSTSSVDSHGWGGVLSGTATWYTESRWTGQLRLNWIKTQHGPETLSLLVGIGYQLDPPPREGPIATATVPPEMKWKQELTAAAGLTILNNNESEKSIAGVLEYRLNFLRYFDWTLSWLHEDDNRIVRRNGLASQLWLVRPFFEDKLSLSIGIGPYLQLDQRHTPQNGEAGAGDFSVLVSTSANYRFTDHWSMRLTWNRLVTNYNSDADIIVIGPGYSF